MPLHSLPAALRPREKLLARGAAALEDAELLALLLRTGLPGKPVLALAQELLAHFDGIAGLLQASADELRQIKGLGGSAKRAELLAVLELARRVLAQQLRQRSLLDNPDAVGRFLQLQLGARAHEVFGVVFLDPQNRLIAFEELFRGTLAESSVYPREVVLRALHHHAAAVILAHNHPSGVLAASAADRAVTRQLQQALALLDIRVLDHLIVSTAAYHSMARAGEL